MIGKIGGFNYTNNDLMKRLARLSSGKKLLNASDDAAGLAISEMMKSQFNGMKQAINNIQNAYSMMNVASGALNDIQDTTGRMKELAVQASNGIYTEQDRKNIQTEYQELSKHLQDVYSNTEYNGKALFSGDALRVQNGPNQSDVQSIEIPNLGKSIQKLASMNLAENPEKALETIDNIKPEISSAQSSIGGVQNSLSEQTNNLMVGYENLVASQSQITDADMAKEVIQATTDKMQNATSIYSIMNFKNTTLSYIKSLLSG